MGGWSIGGGSSTPVEKKHVQTAVWKKVRRLVSLYPAPKGPLCSQFLPQGKVGGK